MIAGVYISGLRKIYWAISISRRVKKMKVAFKLAAIAAALCLAAGAGAHAQTVKKYITRDGKTIYSDKPVPGAREVGAIVAPPMLDPSSPPQSVGAGDSNVKDASAVDQHLREQAARQALIEAAQAELEAARKKLDEGKEPLPDERIGIAGGGSRLKDKYLRRQEQNEQAVADAQKKLEEALARP